MVAAYADAVSSQANLGYSAELLDLTKASVASSTRRYDKGATDILELLTMQSSLVDSQLQSIRSVAELRSARLRLYAYAGLLDSQQISLENH